MSYSAITSRRMPYDIDGTVVGRNTVGSIVLGIDEWPDQATIQDLNNDNLTLLYTINSYGSYVYKGVTLYFFFPEKREIEQIAIMTAVGIKMNIDFQVCASNDTTNGIDGTWETCTWPNGAPTPFYTQSVTDGSPTVSADWPRVAVKTVSFSTSYKVLRVRVVSWNPNSNSVYEKLVAVHIYGTKAAGETADDVIFCSGDGTEISALKDWGDRPEGTVLTDTIYLKNTSTGKIASGVNIQLNDSNYLLSLDQSNWQATLNISSLGIGQISAPIYIKNIIGNPPQTLGLRCEPRMIVTITSWT